MTPLTGLHVETTDAIVRCAIEVHRHLGPGLLESLYEGALCLELAEAGLSVQRQVAVPVHYKGSFIADFRPDLVVSEAVIVEIKSVRECNPVFTAQMLTYLRVTGLRIGLILNFNSAVLKDGIRRVAL